MRKKRVNQSACHEKITAGSYFRYMILFSVAKYKTISEVGRRILAYHGVVFKIGTPPLIYQ